MEIQKFKQDKKLNGFSKEDIKKILTIDFVERKQMNWKLVPDCEWNSYKIEKRNYFIENMCLTSHILATRRYIGNLDCWLNETFPGSLEVLKSFNEKLVVCGGFYSAYRAYDLGDLDFFFYNCTEEDANKILEDVITIICSKLSDFHSIVIERRKYVTTINAHKKVQSGRQLIQQCKYQFIHRLYPSLGSIIGGFDIAASMVAYDGKTLWATQIGAWCYANKTIIIDISRRSTTFTKRLIKYQKRGFGIIFPGLDPIRSPLDADFNKKLKELRIQIRLLGLVHNYDFDSQIGLRESFSLLNIIKIGDFVFRYYPITHVGGGLHNPVIEKRWITKIENPKKHNQRLTSDYELYLPCFSMDIVNAICIKHNKLDVITAYYSVGDIPDRCDNRNLPTIADIIKHNKLDVITAYYSVGDIPDRCDIIDASIRQMYKKLVNAPIIHFTFDVINSKATINTDDVENNNTEKIIWTGNPNSCYESNMILASKELIGNTWIRKNPQRQWTSSINPLERDHLYFYSLNISELNKGKCLWNGFTIGIPSEIETHLRIFFRQYKIPRNIVKMLFSYIVLKSIS